MKYALIFFLFILLLVPQVLTAADFYRTWFTDATYDEFDDYNYSSTPIPRPTAFPTSIENSSYGTRGNGADISHSGAFTSAAFAAGSLSDMSTGAISFWICPLENGKVESNGKDHYILQGGNLTSAAGGFRISWDNRNDRGALLFRMAGKKLASGNAVKVTTCQYDISGWSANEWHHVVAAWVTRTGLGASSKALALWVDRVYVTSVVFGGEVFMNYGNTNVTIGGGGTTNDSKCYIDELVFTGAGGSNEIAYRTFFLTAPYTDIKITNEPFGDSDPYADKTSPTYGGVRSVAADAWVLLGKQKQYGVIGERRLNASGTLRIKEYITGFEGHPAVSYNEWSYYDAKPLISWYIGNGASLVDVNVNGDMIKTGLVQGTTGGATPQITAIFRDVGTPGSADDTTSIAVRTWEGQNAKPDLAVLWVARTPRYSREDAKKWPAPGETVTSTVYLGNFGTADIAANSYNVKFELAIDTDNNFRVDANESWVTINSEITNTPAIPAGVFYDPDDEDSDDLYCSVQWGWPYSAQDPTGLGSASYWIRVTVDSYNYATGGELAEICEANNRRTEKTNAKAARLGYHKDKNPGRTDIPQDAYELAVVDDYNAKRINMTGSFSDFDYENAYVDRLNVMTQTTKCNTAGSVGIQEALRVDDYLQWAWPAELPEYSWEYDGFYPEIFMKEDASYSNLYLYITESHELGHNLMQLPDLYGTPYSVDNVLPVAPGSVEFPVISGSLSTAKGREGMLSSHGSGNADQYGVGNHSFMSSCQLWLDPQTAGFYHHRRQNRSIDAIYWGDYAPHGEGKNQVQLYKYNGQVLKNAEVYAYPVRHYDGPVYGHPNKYVVNQVKFAGISDATTGIFTFPVTTTNNWDDWSTNLVVEQEETCVSPFDRHSGDGTACDSQDVKAPMLRDAEFLLIKIIGRDPLNYNDPVTEYHLLALAELNSAFFANGGSQGTTGVYAIRTSLDEIWESTSINLDDAVENDPPAAVLDGPDTVGVGNPITLYCDGSSDGDGGSNLWCWWGAWNPSDPDNADIFLIDQTYETAQSAKTYTFPGYSTPGTYNFYLYVLDGLKMSVVESTQVVVQ